MSQIIEQESTLEKLDKIKQFMNQESENKKKEKAKNKRNKQMQNSYTWDIDWKEVKEQMCHCEKVNCTNKRKVREMEYEGLATIFENEADFPNKCYFCNKSCTITLCQECEDKLNAFTIVKEMMNVKQEELLKEFAACTIV